MSSWQKSQYAKKRYFKDDKSNNNIINTQTDLINNIEYVISYTEIQKLVESYDFKFVIFKNQPVANAMGIGDLLWNILHLQNKVWKSPIYINVYYFGFKKYYPNPKNALLFRLELLNDILSNHKTLNKTDIFFYLNKDLNQVYNTHFLYNKLTNIKLDSLINFPKYLDEEYIVFHTKLRLRTSDKDINYQLVKKQVKELCSNFKCKYKIVILGERIMPQTAESSVLGITTIYDELLL